MKARPEHFSVDNDGDLYDRRTRRTVRRCYSRTFANIKTGQQFRACLRAGQWAWPGGYPMHFVTSDGEALSFDSATAEARSIIHSIRNRLDDGWRVVACVVNYEDASLVCAHSGLRIESAYGEQDEEPPGFEDDGDALASAGWGTDEDYGCFDPDE